MLRFLIQIIRGIEPSELFQVNMAGHVMYDDDNICMCTDQKKRKVIECEIKDQSKYLLERKWRKQIPAFVYKNHFL